MEKDPEHPIIKHPHKYNIIGFYYHINLDDFLESYIDLTMKYEDLVRSLRFYGPQDLEIEKGFPENTGGMKILDVRKRQLDAIGVWVTDVEASHGSLTFWAKNVIDLDNEKT